MQKTGGKKRFSAWLLLFVALLCYGSWLYGRHSATVETTYLFRPGCSISVGGTSEPGAEAFLSLSNDWILITSKGEYLVDLMSDTAYLVYNKPFRVSGSKLVVVRPPPFEVVRYGVVPYEVTHPFKQDKTGFEFQSASGQVITVKCPESAMAPPAYDGFDIERFIKGLVP